MGFCRRCGDIVTAARCKCGGTAVAPAVPFTKTEQVEERPDKWSRTYVSRDRSPTRRPTSTSTIATHMTGSTNDSSEGPPSPTKRFPRPLSTSSSKPISNLGSRVSTHIASTTSKLGRPPSPLKQSTTPAPEADILPSLYGSSLTKVYGSVLQTNESLPTHSCAICNTKFQPDATIYPDPNDPSSTERFLCLSCFSANGGSKGNCPTCSRPVLAIKSQGGFVHASGKVWHKRCFNCTGCHKNVGDAPVVNLLGQPSCAECFEGCLKRDSTPKKTPRAESVTSSPNLGGIKASNPMSPISSSVRTRESSPALEELEQRLGIRSREPSPALEELDRRLSSLTTKDRTTPTRKSTSSRYSYSDTPERSPLASRSTNIRELSPSPTRSEVRSQLTGSTARYSMGGSPRPIPRNHTGGSSTPTEDAIAEMKRRFLKESASSTSEASSVTSTPSRRLRTSRSSASLTSSPSAAPKAADIPPAPMSDYDSNIPPTPDLMSDFSDTTTQSSFLDSPPNSIGDRMVMDAAKMRQAGHGTRYTRGDFLEYDQDIPPPKLRSRTMSTPTSSPLRKTTPVATPTTPSKKPAADLPTIEAASPSSCCAKCGGSLFSTKMGNASKYVTVPSDDTEKEPKGKTYHTECFRCAICEGVFKQGGKGQAIFVRAAGGPCHVDCAPAEKYVVKSTVVIPPLLPSKSASPVISAMKTSLPPVAPSKSSSSRYARPPTTAPPTVTTFRFGSSSNCPGCNKAVSPMERGVVPGPQGTKWHASCLVCGGKKEPVGLFGLRKERKKGEPGCGKKLDSAAKGDGEGGVWCRECSLLLPLTMRSSPQGSPVRPSAVMPEYTGGTTRSIVPQSTGTARSVMPQSTGTTTLARQFTGLGGDPALIRQLTGGGLSPTRQLSSSPTKQLGAIGGIGRSGRPRPKSMIGFRTIDEEGKTSIFSR